MSMKMAKRYQRFILSVAGSFIMASGFGFYYAPHHPRIKFIIVCNIYWLAIFLSFWVFVFLFKKIFRKKHEFWTDYFVRKMPELFFFVSLFSVALMGRSEIMSLALVLLFTAILYFRMQKFFDRHPDGCGWKAVNRRVFSFGAFLFVLFSCIQYLSNQYYILDNATPFHVTVLLRAFVMTAFWLTGFIWSFALYHKHRGGKRYFLLLFWGLAFLFSAFFWIANIGVLMGSGLYLTPTAVEHASGAGKVIFNSTTVISVLIAFACVLFLCWLCRGCAKSENVSRQRPWFNFAWLALGLTILLAMTVAPIKNTPEAEVIYSFYQRYLGKSESATIAPEILKKLNENFGIIYHPEQHQVNTRDKIFNEAKDLLPLAMRAPNTPNILVVFFESLSTCLTDVYIDVWNGVLTPNLKDFSEDRHTTIFKNFYNSSTPTVTGLLAELCSFLPPTGHKEIHEAGRLSRFYLRCLPNILREQGGFKKAIYITAVEKEFANKGAMLKNIGVDEFYGTDELYKFIPGEPIGWGWTDHQMFPALPQFLESAPEPFLIMFATVDSHHPYTAAEDMTDFRDGKSVVLNSFHTTDDAFGKFWRWFKKSRFYDNTIMIVVADHAIFPASLRNVPEYKGKQEYEDKSFYDETALLMHIPGNILPKTVSIYSSSIDFAPTLLHLLSLNVQNSFEGHSIFDDRQNYPNLLGMHEFGLYINQETDTGREILYDLPVNLSRSCAGTVPTAGPKLTLCEFEQFYQWKRKMLEEGRLWMK